MDFDTLINRYAKLIVRHGLSVQAGQIVNIAAEVCHREFAFRIAQEAYEVGALYVNIDLIEGRLSRERIIHSDLEAMQYVPAYLATKYDELVDSMAANLRIVGPEDPDILLGLDAKKINSGRVAQYQALKRFYEDGIGRSKVHWTVAAAATPGWAMRLFPKLSAEQATMELWQQIFRICRVDSEHYLEAWAAHNRTLHERAQWLTDLGIKTLHFTGPGTDLRVGLSESALFKAGGEMGPRGVEFEPNIPTEECFTTPDARITEGKVRTTRPFFINGTLICNLELEFQAGEISRFQASSGEETFREYISSDPGGKRLGEVALVGIDSPVYKSGLVFQEILLDENAACHIAIGSAYKFCLRNGAQLSAEELEQLGCNQSSVHTDMMISSEQVDVVALLGDGTSITLIKSGKWTR